MSFTTKYGPSHVGSDVVDTLTQSDLIQIDPQRHIVFEIPPPDVISSISQFFENAVNGGSNAESSPSDSDSLFLTQSVAPVVRTVKRHQSSERPEPPISVDSEDEHEGDHNQDNKPHQEERRETLQKRDSDSQDSDDDLISKTQTALTRGGESRHCRRPRSARRPAPPRPTREAFPFLKKRHSSRISVHKNHVLVNSVIGGFFKCLKNIKNEHQERIELCSSTFPFVLRDDGMELDEDDDEDDIDDIKKVDAECFVLNTHKRNREPWFPKERWKLKLDSKKHERESNRVEAKTGERGGKKDLEEEKDLEKPRDQMQDQICTRYASRSSLCPPASPNRSVFIAQEEDEERPPEILVACTQTQSMDWHCGDHSGLRVTRGRENMEATGPESETVVEETQRPDSEEEASERHAPGTLEDDEMGPQEMGFERGDWMYSQDLFAQKDSLADEIMESRPLKECTFRESNDDLESCVMQNDDVCLFGNNRNADKPDLSLDQVDGSLVDNAKLLRSSQSKILSPRTKKIINLAKKENNKKQPTDGNVTLSCPEENGHNPPLSDVDPDVHPTLVNNPSASKVNVDSGSCRDITTGIQETVASPLFNYGGLSFLKRKTKRTKASKVSSSSTLLQPSTDQNKSLTSLAEDSGSETVRKKRRSLVNTVNEDEMITRSELLVEAGVSLPKNTGSVDKVSELKAKEKRKRYRDVQLLLPVDEAYVEEGVCTSTQTPHHAPECLVSVANGHKKLRVTDLSSPSRNNEYSSPSIHGDVSENVLPLVDFESQRKKRKKAKKNNLQSEMYDEVIVQCDGELEVCHDTGTKNAKRKTPGSYLDDSCVKRQSGEIAAIKFQSESAVGSLNSSEAACFIEHPTNKSDDLVTPRKRKKKEVLGNVEALEQFEISEEIQDSEQPAAKVIPDTKVKKKKHRSTCQNTEVAHEEDGMETLCTSESVDPPSSGMELNVNHQGDSSEIHEESGGYGPDCFDGSTSLKMKKKKKKRKTLENGFSVASDGIGSIEGSQADLNLNGSEPEQSVSQTEGLHEPEREKKKKKKKKKERQSETDRNMGGDLCDDDAECVGYQQSLQGSLLTTSETTVQKKRKKKSRCDGTDSDQNICPALPQELKMVENPREVLVTQHDKEQQKEGSVVSAADELLQYIEKKKKKKKTKTKEQVVKENVEAGQVDAPENCTTPKEIQDSEQPAAKVIPDTKVKKKKHRSTCQNTEVAHEEDGMETPCTSESVDPPSSGMELNVNHQGDSSEIHEESGGYGPDCFDGSTSLKMKKKKKKRKTLENGFSVASDGIGSIEGSQADLNLNGSEPEQSVSQTEGLHEPEREKKKKKKKKKERQSETDRNMGGDLGDDDAECVVYQQSLQGSLLTTSETTVQKKRKKKSRCDGTDSDQNTCPALPQELKMVENPREVLVTQHDKEQQKEGSVVSAADELLQYIEKKKKKKKTKTKEQVVKENVEAAQVDAPENCTTPKEIQDSEQPAAKVIPDTKVKKKKHRSTCQNTEVAHEEDGMETLCTSESVDPPSSGMELNVNHQGDSSKIHEESGGYGPDCFDGSTSLKMKKKKKKRKTLENGFSVASDGIGSIEGSQADLNLNGSEPEQSVSQTEGLHEPEREKKKKKKKKKKERQSETDRNMGGDLCDDDAECVGYQQSLQGSLLTTSETTVQKKRKKKSRCDGTDSDQNTCPALPQELKMVENPREVLVTQHDKGQQKEGSVVSFIETKKKKKRHSITQCLLTQTNETKKA